MSVICDLPSSKFDNLILCTILSLQHNLENCSCDKGETMTLDDCRRTNFREAELPEIPQHILSFLDFEAFTVCVNPELNGPAAPNFSKFFKDNRFSPVAAKFFGKFTFDFCNCSLFSPFETFCFGSPESSVNFSDIQSFIRTYGIHIRELSFLRLNIRFDVTTPFNNRYLNNLIPSNLTKLDIVCGRTKFTIPMDRLRHIKALRIERGIMKIVHIVKGAEAAPVELCLINAIGTDANGTDVPINLNKIFDFRNLKILQLDCSDTQNMELDLTGDLSLNSLTLESVKLTNSDYSNWTVKGMMLGEKMNLLRANYADLEELDFIGDSIDFALLPKSLKGLSLYELKTEILNIESACNFTELKRLTLHRDEFSILSHFKTCPKLTTLHLIPDNRSSKIDLSYIPRSLKVLRVTGLCKLIGTADSHLDTTLIEDIGLMVPIAFVRENRKSKNHFVSSSSFATIKKVSVLELMKSLFENHFVWPSDENEFNFFIFSDEQNAEYYIAKDREAVLKKDYCREDIERIKDLWWENTLERTLE